MKKIPISRSDFKALRDADHYYVDKSMLIGQIIDMNEMGVFLYTRPRRFGKSMNLSMIDAFFNIEYKGNTWFDGLEISEHPEYDRFRNAHPVLSVNLWCAGVEDYDVYLEDMRVCMAALYRRYSYLEESVRVSESMKAMFRRILGGEGTETDTARALADLCEMLYSHHGSRVVVLVDEYDSAVNSTSDPEICRRVLSFMRRMFTPLLKDNDLLQLAVITGILQIAKENLFSGLNNLYVNNVLSDMSDEMFGFTADEVRQICEDFGHPEKFEEAREWYDGYRFGNADVYNPLSITYYVAGGFKPDAFWVNTSSNSIVRNLLEQADDAALENLRILGSGGSISGDVQTAVTFDDLVGDPGLVYSMMVVSGYLKAIPNGNDGYLLSIPNTELATVFESEIIRHACGTSRARLSMNMFCTSLITGDVKGASDHIHNLLKDAVSSRVLDSEHSYQAFLTGVLMILSTRFDVKADYEAGDGYFDIRLKRIRGPGSNVVIELKKSAGEGSMQTDAENALEQIKAKNYAHGLEGSTILYGIAFSGKRPCIISEKI